MICEDCVKGFTIEGEPQGKLVDGAYYIAASPGSKSKTAVVVLTDIFGLALNNSKILADLYAKTLNVDVWVPDLFNGKPPIAVDVLEPLVPSQPNEKRPISTYFKFGLLAFTHGYALYANRAAVGIQRVTPFMEKIRKEYEHVGVVGFCYGGRLAIHFGSTDLVDTVVIAHPGGGTAHESIVKIKKPNAWLCAEQDFSFSQEDRQAAEKEMASRKGKENYVDYVFYDYEGTTHGFAVRPAQQHPKVKAGFEKSIQDTVNWFQKTLLKTDAAAHVTEPGSSAA